jgi:hypothetical protein
MANNIIDVPLISPVRFFPRGEQEYINFDTSPWLDIIPPQNNPTSYGKPAGTYTQKWFNDGVKYDPIRIQITTTFGPAVIALLDCEGDDIAVYPGTAVSNPAVLTGWTLYEWELIPPVGNRRYYWELRVGVAGPSPEEPGTLEKRLSEPQETISTRSNTLLWRYKNSRNRFDVIFGTGIEFFFRCEGWKGRVIPRVKGTTTETQSMGIETNIAKPYREWPVYVGQKDGVADWVSELVNRIHCCDSVFMNELMVTRPAGNELQANANPNYPKAEWSMTVRQTKNTQVVRTENNNSPAEFFFVTYNLNTRLFGPMNTPPSGGNVTITGVE